MSSQSTTPSAGSAASDPHPEPGRRDALYRSLVDDAFGFTVAIRSDFTMAFVSQSVWKHVERTADSLTGESVADFLHPDDLERALLLMSGWTNHGAPNGMAGFRLKHADGSWLSFDVTASHVTDGVEAFLAVYCSPVDYQKATDEVLSRLLRGAGRAEALRSGARRLLVGAQPGRGGHHLVRAGRRDSARSPPASRPNCAAPRSTRPNRGPPSAPSSSRS